MNVEIGPKAKLPRRLLNRAHDSMFRLIHSSSLIYNTCWEDPRLDRQMLGINAKSRIVMITSAGCNALDYLLDGPAEIHAIDVNPRQNALMRLKLALFSLGDYEELWRTLGEGQRKDFLDLLEKLKPDLDEASIEFWRKKHHYFEGSKRRSTFYYRGAAGSVAWALVEALERLSPGGKKDVAAFFGAQTIEEQQSLYRAVEGRVWNAFNCWLIKQPFTMALLGVPRPQINLIQTQYPGGLGSYVRDNVENTLTKLPIWENYFWRVYSLGSYSKSCCPNYLKAENFKTLRERCGNVRLHTTTMSEFLQANPGRYTHFVLLDHQDWLASHNPAALLEEWELILANSVPGTKVLMRSASPKIEFIPAKILERLRLDERAASLHRQDRVGTYGCTLLAEVI